MYVDLENAIDKIPYKRLLWKLENIGVLKGVSERPKDEGSEGGDRILGRKDITVGVSYCSVLAPVKFVTYINDTEKCQRLCYPIRRRCEEWDRRRSLWYSRKTSAGLPNGVQNGKLNSVEKSTGNGKKYKRTTIFYT